MSASACYRQLWIHCPNSGLSLKSIRPWHSDVVGKRIAVLILLRFPGRTFGNIEVVQAVESLKNGIVAVMG
jgi:hypothetical protein